MNIFFLTFFCVRFTALEINVFFEFIYFFCCFCLLSLSVCVSLPLISLLAIISICGLHIVCGARSNCYFYFFYVYIIVCACDMMVNVLEFSIERKIEKIARLQKKPSRKKIKTKNQKKNGEEKTMPDCLCHITVFIDINCAILAVDVNLIEIYDHIFF